MTGSREGRRARARERKKKGRRSPLAAILTASLTVVIAVVVIAAWRPRTRRDSPAVVADAPDAAVAPDAPDAPDTSGADLVDLGRAALVDGDLNRAAVLYRAALDQAPRHVEANYALALVVHRLGIDASAAEVLFRRTLKLDSNHSDALAGLGDLLMDMGGNREDEAVDSFNRALALKPESVMALNNLGCLHRRRGRVSEARACFEKALEARPDSVSARTNLGSVFKDAGDLDAALEQYVLALAREPKNAAANYNAALVLLTQNRAETAVPFLRLALEQRDAARSSAVERRAGGPAPTRAGSDGDDSSDRRAINPGPGGSGQAGGPHWRDSSSDLEVLDAAEFLLEAALGSDNPSRTGSHGRRAHVRALFDSYAARFDHHLVDQLDYRAPATLYRLVVAALDSSDPVRRTTEGSDDAPPRRRLRVVDVGCGTGLAGSLFRNISGLLVGGDLSTNMILKAKEKTRPDGRPLYDELHVEVRRSRNFRNLDMCDTRILRRARTLAETRVIDLTRSDPRLAVGRHRHIGPV